MNKQQMIGSIPLALLAVGVGVTSLAKETGVPDSEQVSKLLSEAKTQAFQLKEDASTMEAYTRSNLGWESHAAAVEQVKEHINAAGRTLAKLAESRKTASPWQMTAIDRIAPLLKEIASNTETVIKYINKNPKRLFMTEYKDYIETNADVADKLAGLISDFVDYGNTKNKLERLTAKLELPGK
jgi:hypothetical protein